MKNNKRTVKFLSVALAVAIALESLSMLQISFAESLTTGLDDNITAVVAKNENTLL